MANFTEHWSLGDGALTLCSLDPEQFLRFPSHGFFEIGSSERARYCPSDLDMTGVDFDDVSLLMHCEQSFNRRCTSEDIEGCKWMQSMGEHR
jgi:hypothetical protein